MTPVYQNQPFTFVFLLKDSLGARLTGLVSTDVNVNISAPGSSSFSQVANTNFTEIGFGYYSIDIAEANTAALGELIAIATGTGAEDFDKMYTVVPSPTSAVDSPDLCEISGNIVDITGMPSRGNMPVVVRGGSAPITIGSSFLASTKVVTNTDADGNFSVKLLRNQTVSFQIEGVGLKKIVITVPDQSSANLADLIPS